MKYLYNVECLAPDGCLLEWHKRVNLRTVKKLIKSSHNCIVVNLFTHKSEHYIDGKLVN